MICSESGGLNYRDEPYAHNAWLANLEAGVDVPLPCCFYWLYVKSPFLISEFYQSPISFGGASLSRLDYQEYRLVGSTELMLRT